MENSWTEHAQGDVVCGQVDAEPQDSNLTETQLRQAVSVLWHHALYASRFHVVPDQCSFERLDISHSSMASIGFQICGVASRSHRREIRSNLFGILQSLAVGIVSCSLIGGPSSLFHRNLPTSISHLSIWGILSKHDSFAGVTQSKFKAV